MKRIALGALLVVLVAGSVTVWWYGQGRTAATALRVSGGQLTVRWSGHYRGDASLAARIRWCPVTRLGVLEAISGDTGVAVVLYDRDAIIAGPRPVFSPDLAAAAPRPGATVALRWAAASDTLVGFRSTSGQMTLQLDKGTASGTISARLQSSAGAETLEFRAAFKKLPILATAAGCT